MKYSKFRGFIFSLDAFVAFTLALVTIYSMIFFSSIPSAYYNSLTQAHYLSKDTLLSLSQTKCSHALYPQCDDENASVLDWLILRDSGRRDLKGNVNFFIGTNIPNQFGYVLESSNDGSIWTSIYDTSTGNTLPDDAHNNKKQKLSVSSYTVIFDYRDQLKSSENPYTYMTCSGDAVVCDVPQSPYEVPSASMKIIKLTIFI